MYSNEELVGKIIQDIESDLTDEEIIHLLLEEKVASSKVYNASETNSFGQKAADSLAAFVGSWKFISIFVFCLIAWMLINILALATPFDPYPFILLNLVLSCVAAIQAPLIMMSQNRQEQKDRLRAENDYKVNLKSEIVVEDLHKKIDLLMENQALLIRMMESSKTPSNEEEPRE